MRRAKEFAEKFVDLSIFAAHHREDRDIVPHDFKSTRELDRSVIDLGNFQIHRKLPLIADILDRLYQNSDAEYFIYTNIDIALMPEFYVAVNEIIERGYDAFIINRRTISDAYNRVDQIPLMYAEIGQSHPGYDCFVFRRDAYKNYRLGNICVGINYVGLALKYNLMCHSKRFKEFLNLHLTFHIGDDKQWKQDKYEDYRQHNESEYHKITAELRTDFNFSLPGNSDSGFAGKNKLNADLQFSGVSQINDSNNNAFSHLKEKNIFFVLSTGRSGTQTIARSLAEIPDCVCLHEPTPQLITESSAYRYGRIDVGKLAKVIAETRHPVINGKLYGESNQTLSLLVPVLTEVFPDAKFIWLIRNGLDVVASIYSRQWYTGHSTNHSRYEDCPPIEKEWIDGRIMGDLCGDVAPAKWKSMDPFARCCWYWAYTNRIIENDLNKFVTINNSTIVRLEEIDRDLTGVIDWLGLSIPLKMKVQRHNRAHYKLHTWQKWSKSERQTFLYWCGPSMDRLYPEWRTDHADFFTGNGLAKSNKVTNMFLGGDASRKALSAESAPQKTDLPSIHYTPHLSSKPKISVYITSYNQKKYLMEAIESVLNQTFNPHQIIIVDDFSQDGSQDLIAKYAKNYPDLIHPSYHTRNLGVSRTRIDALNSVTGDYVTYVDGDDRFLPNKLELELKTLLDHDDTHIVYSNNCYIDLNGRRQYIWAENERPPQGSIFKETFSREFPRRNLFRMELVHYQAWKSVGFHDPNITIYEDFDMRIRLTRHFRVAYCDEILSEIRLHNHGLSSSKAAQHLTSLDYIYQKNQALLMDLERGEREQTQKRFRSWVNMISHIAADEQSNHNRSNSGSATVSPSARAASCESDRGGGQDSDLGSNLIFLISQPRSGSTMLQRILAGHPDIHSTAEPWLMLHPLYALKGNGIKTEYRSILARQGLDDFLMNIPEGPELYIRALRQMGSVLYNRAIELSGKRFFLDKTPRYYHVIPELYRVYPKAKFIFLFRNPLAVLSSMLKTWFENRPQALGYPNYNDLLKGPIRLVDGINRLNENAIVVNYETLVESPVDETRRICNRIGIPFDNHMLEYGKFPKPKGRHGDPVGVYRHDRPVEMYIEKWVENLSSPELSRFAHQYLDAMNPKVVAHLGYSIENLKDMLDGRASPKQVSPAKDLKKFKINQKHDNRYLVSAVVSTYNSEKYIRGCLDDLENQTISDRLEIIVINSGSEQNEDAIVRDYQKRFSNIRYLKTEHRENLYHAWNRGIEMATGKYITNANTDDAHRKDALELLADAMQRHPEAGLAYAHCAWTLEPNYTFADASTYKTVIYPDYNPALSMFFCFLGPHPMWRRTVFKDIGCFDPKYRAAGDYEFQMRFTAAELKAVLVPEVLSLFYQNYQGLTLQSQISQQEASQIYAKYRASIPISRLYRVDPTSSEDLAEAWTAQGNLATCFQAPWVDHVQVDLSYAYHCYRQALKHKPDFTPAMHNLAIIIGLMSKGPVWEQMVKLLPPAEQKSLQNTTRDNFRNYLVPVNATQKTGSIAYKPKSFLRANSTQPAIKWFGPIYDPSGYADEGRNFLLNLQSKFPHLSARAIGRQSEIFRAQLDIATRHSLDAMLAREGDADSICVTHFPAYAFRRHSNAFYHIGRTMFETDGLPADWVAKCNQMDEIWVPTDFNIETFRRAGVTAKLIKIPEGIDTEKYCPGYDPLPVPGLRKTVFLSIFEWIYRKGWDTLLRAWSRAFSADDDVSLLLRSYPMNVTEGLDEKQEIESQINTFLTSELGLERSAVAPIIVLHQQVPDKAMPRLYASANALVAPSRGEGWGRPHMEAMACGLPVIATRWSGNLEFMNDSNSYLIDVDEIVQIDERTEIPFYRGQRWAEPSVDHLTALLRKIVERPQESHFVGLRARSEMKAKWQWSKVVAQAAERLRKIGASTVKVPVNTTGQTKLAINWEGSQFVYHSLALVNRELCVELAQREELELSLIPCEPHQFAPQEENGRYQLIENCLDKPLSAPADVHVRHRWPPDFNPPDQGHWVMIQPWEFGALPASWVKPMQELVDELWVPSTYVRDVYVNSGISSSKVVVVPNGVNYDYFHPDIAPLSLNTSKSFKFLFVGGTLWRKGIDVLLEAYSRAFTASDDVCLVIKDLGGQSFYMGRSADERIRVYQGTPGLPEILYISQNLKEGQLPGLYTACNCLVHPYRGEGFGLPVAEAMACGLPVVVTRGGACDDFCSSHNAYLLPASRRPIQMEGFQLVGQGWVLEPDKDELIRILRSIYKNMTAAGTKGRQAAQDIRAGVCWKQSANIIIDRLKALKSKPILRFQNETKLIRNAPLWDVPPRAGAGSATAG
jgi:glycosyltransferase involved in cell wall biosynthesis